MRKFSILDSRILKDLKRSPDDVPALLEKLHSLWQPTELQAFWTAEHTKHKSSKFDKRANEFKAALLYLEENFIKTENTYGDKILELSSALTYADVKKSSSLHAFSIGHLGYQISELYVLSQFVENPEEHLVRAFDIAYMKLLHECPKISESYPQIIDEVKRWTRFYNHSSHALNSPFEITIRVQLASLNELVK